jgi:hypothetical protein
MKKMLDVSVKAWCRANQKAMSLPEFTKNLGDTNRFSPKKKAKSGAPRVLFIARLVGP